MITKIVTARGNDFFVGGFYDPEGNCIEIVFVGGDYEVSSPSVYRVEFSSGAWVEIRDAAEIWHDPEPECDEVNPDTSKKYLAPEAAAFADAAMN